MKIVDKISYLKEKVSSDIKLLEMLIPVEDFVSHVSDGVVYAINTTFDGSMNILHNFSITYGKYEMSHYYMNSGCFTIAYHFNDFVLQLFCIDVQNALKKVGNGKCQIVEVHRTEEHIVCDI